MRYTNRRLPSPLQVDRDINELCLRDTVYKYPEPATCIRWHVGYPDTSCSSGIHVSGRHVSWYKPGIWVPSSVTDCRQANGVQTLNVDLLQRWRSPANTRRPWSTCGTRTRRSWRTSRTRRWSWTLCRGRSEPLWELLALSTQCSHLLPPSASYNADLWINTNHMVPYTIIRSITVKKSLKHLWFCCVICFSRFFQIC